LDVAIKLIAKVTSELVSEVVKRHICPFSSLVTSRV
jgi:hypothetical protein